MKKTLSLFLGVVLVLTSLSFSIAIAPIAFAGSFSDVPDSHPNATAIEYVKSMNMVDGYPDGTYRPDETINRAEFTKIVTTANYDMAPIDLCLERQLSSSEPTVFFSDVSRFEWYAKYICIAKVNNVIGGYPDGTFRPGEKIKFVEAAKIIVNIFGYETVTDEVWYKPFIDMLAAKGAIPTSIDSFEKYITRGEMAEIIYRVHGGITNLPSWTYDDLKNGVEGATPQENETSPETGTTTDTSSAPRVTGYSSSGDEIVGWNWVRDSGLSEYAEWTIENVPTDASTLSLDWYVLATNTYSGGGGFNADFRIYYGSPDDAGDDEQMAFSDVHFDNDSLEGDPVGYNCHGSLAIPVSVLNGEKSLYLKAVRTSSANHVAFFPGSVERINGMAVVVDIDGSSESDDGNDEGDQGDDTTLADQTTLSNGEYKTMTEVETILEGEDSMADADEDGMPDKVEANYQTDPDDSDSDNDGVEDGKDISPLINPSEPEFESLQKIGMVRIEQPIKAWGLDGWCEVYDYDMTWSGPELTLQNTYEDTGTKKSTMNQSEYKKVLNSLFDDAGFVAYKMKNITPSEIAVEDVENTHDQDDEDSVTFEADLTALKTNEYRFYYDYITDYQIAYLKNDEEISWPSEEDPYFYILQKVRLKASREQSFVIQFEDQDAYDSMYFSDDDDYMIPAFMYSFYATENFSGDSVVPKHDGIAVALDEGDGIFEASFSIPKEKTGTTTLYLKITPTWIKKTSSWQYEYTPWEPDFDLTGVTRNIIHEKKEDGTTKVAIEEFSSIEGWSTEPKNSTFFQSAEGDENAASDSSWFGIIFYDPESEETPYAFTDAIKTTISVIDTAGGLAQNAYSYTESFVTAVKKVDGLDELPDDHWARSARYNGPLAAFSAATGVISIATNGYEAWSAYKDGNAVDFTYYALQTVGSGLQTASSLVTIAQNTASWSGKAAKFSKLATKKFAVGLTVAIGVVEVAYDIAQVATTDDEIVKMAYTEKIVADTFDTGLSVMSIFVPHALVFQLTWSVEAEVYALIFGEDFAYKVAQSPGSALVFLSEYFLTTTVPSQLAEEAYLYIRGGDPDNGYDFGIIEKIEVFNAVELPYLSIFIDPDFD